MVIPGGIAVDMSGNAWIADGGNTVTELSSSGQPLSPSLPYGTGGWTSGPYYSPSLCVSNALAIDATGNTWVTSNGESSSCTTGGVARFTSSGTLLSGADGYLSNGLFEPTAIAIDGSGNAWLDDDDHYSMIEFSNTGSVLSGSSGYSRSLLYSQSLAIDSSGSIWVAGMANGGNTNELVKFSQSGVALGTYPGVGWWPVGVAIDGLGKAWVASYPLYAGTGLNAATGIISEYSSSGEALSGSSGYVGSGLPSRIYEGKSTNGEIYEPVAMAIDGSGDIWLANGGGVTELIGVAAPVITPIAAGLPTVPTSDGTSRLGTRP
jgi:streptogramin lyase